MRAVDQADSARYSLEEVLEPAGWVLLNFLMDSRTGLGRFRNFRISNHQLMMQLIDACQRHDIDEILELPDVRERVELYFQETEAFVAQLRRCTTVRGSVVVIDLRAEDVIHAGNRFMVYALFPDCSVSAHVLWGKQRQNTVIAVGKSILEPHLAGRCRRAAAVLRRRRSMPTRAPARSRTRTPTALSSNASAT
jgi:nanoRNase/pAp phosphatase (c-di-AMP/oligoRNAs hydrolase)